MEVSISKLRMLYEFMLYGSQAMAKWEKEMADNILKRQRRFLLLVVLLLPVFFTHIYLLQTFQEAKMPMLQSIIPA